MTLPRSVVSGYFTGNISSCTSQHHPIMTPTRASVAASGTAERMEKEEEVV